MSTLALTVDQAMRVLDPLKQAELEHVISGAIQRLIMSEPNSSLTEEQKEANFRECAGSLPDFPDDFIESPWETNREPLL